MEKDNYVMKGILLSLIFSGIGAYCINNCDNIDCLICIPVAPIIMIEFILDGFIPKNLVINTIIIIISNAFIGGVIGWMYGKIKNRNKILEV